MFRPATLVAIISMHVWLCTFVRSEDAEMAGFFETKIRPVLVAECYECHSSSSKNVKGGLLIDTRDGIRRGGDSGHGVVPGEPADSLILEAMRHDGLEMPPEKKLDAKVVADFRKWILAGAYDPRDGKSDLVRETVDLQQMFIGETRRVFDTWKMDGLPYEM